MSSSRSTTSETLVEFITIGREILDGRVIDTNAVKMAEMIRPLGLVPRFAQRVDDQIERIVDAFQIAQRRSNIVLVTGGLGPTSDDLTSEAFAKFLGEELTFRQEAMDHIADWMKRFSRPLLDAQKKQAYFPKSCFTLPNPEGTAPGFGLERDGKQWFFMPGVPREMLRMLKEQVVPRLPARPLYRTKIWATHFTAEAALQQSLNPVEDRLPENFEITYQTRFPENHIGLCADCRNEEDLALFSDLSSEIDRILGDQVFVTAPSSDQLKSLDQVVVDRCAESRQKIYIVESTSAGLLTYRFKSCSQSESSFSGAIVLTEPEKGGEEELKKQLLETSVPENAWIISALGDREARQGWSGLYKGRGEPVIESFKAPIVLDQGRFQTLLAQKALDLLRRQLAV